LTGSSANGVQNATLNFAANQITAAGSPAEQAFAYAFDAGDIAGIQAESTLMRIRGSLLMEKNTVAGAIEGHVTFAFGIAVVESTNLLGPFTKFPNPANPVGAQWDGWMFYRSINTAILDAEASIIDVKSMRKIQSGYSLIFVYGGYASSDDDANVTTPALQATLTARGLFLLP